MDGKPWTEEEEAFVIAKHKLGVPYPEIAGLLHMSGLSPSYRSNHAICGRVYRLGLAKPAVQKARHHAPQPAPVGTGRLSEPSWARGPFPSVKACQWREWLMVNDFPYALCRSLPDVEQFIERIKNGRD